MSKHGVAAAATLLGLLLQFKICFSYSTSNVIIVGAGASGIAAASKLLENNLTNFTILEAQNRIGGRIYSVKFGDAVVDLGAQWCHGEKNNVVFEMVKDLNLLRPGILSFDCHHSSRKEIDVEFLEELVSIFEDLLENAAHDANGTFGGYIRRSYNQSIFKNFGNDSKKIEEANEILDSFLKTTLLVEGAFSLDDVSAKSDYQVCEGNEGLGWKGRGYKTILDVLMKKYPNPDEQLPIDDKILLNKEVTEIVWDNDDNSHASVRCKDGSVYNAETVIFTPSLGVLKSTYKTLFKPALPEEKVNAIQALGIGAVIKVFLHFPVRWWPNKFFNDFVFIWSEKDRKQLVEEFPKGPVTNGMSWLSDLTEILGGDKENPNVVAVWFGGEFIPEIETLSDDLIIDGIMFALDKFLGHKFPNISKPDSIIRNNWYSNPYFRGTYSFQTIKSHQLEESPEAVLAKPLDSSYGKQTLLFAGEATNPIHYSTVHGAIETGFREAQRVIVSLNK